MSEHPVVLSADPPWAGGAGAARRPPAQVEGYLQLLASGHQRKVDDFLQTSPPTSQYIILRNLRGLRKDRKWLRRVF